MRLTDSFQEDIFYNGDGASKTPSSLVQKTYGGFISHTYSYSLANQVNTMIDNVDMTNSNVICKYVYTRPSEVVRPV